MFQLPNFPTSKLPIVFGIILFVLLAWAVAPPSSFPIKSIITVPVGSGLYALSENLEEQGVIRSPFWFRTAAIMLGGERGMKAGQYYMSRPQNPFVIAWRILHGRYEIKTVKLTIPEGFTVEKISALFDEKNFPYFDNTLFEKAAPEGFLFPDTYFMPVTATASSTEKIMRDNFIRKIFPLMPEVELSKKTLEDIITMASLIEGETNNQTDREIVSGVLWKRLKLGMPLQVDVEMKTYEFPGLPANPINNPGILSIKAALTPTTTPYFYYLTGKDGKMHYAKTFDEHIINKQKYIN
ncbi:MAG: endolytic transglycosylase MltG [bacterium]|nr:endolytic transglycosylase MltG [bacterium]